jgi:predicted transposase YdaD
MLYQDLNTDCGFCLGFVMEYLIECQVNRLLRLIFKATNQRYLDFMKMMAQIDEWYEAEMKRADIQGKAIGEQNQKQSIALNMLRKNMDIEMISEVTGLTIEQLQALQDNG